MLENLQKKSDLLLAAGIMIILGLMIIPVPPIVLDMSLSFSITFAIVVILVSSYIARPLDFSVFPSVLLIATLLRLSLNIASTRLILTHGDSGTQAAGKVIQSFGEFVIGGNFVVGFVVFMILVIINFVVITKGSGRIAEVSARFILDAMPGKQMSIDADLNAGLVDETEARRRRQDISREADFYGSMDGASKFIRGDAIAGIIIMVINIIGGFLIGVLQKGMTVSDAIQTYTILTVGEGLVAQIPALITSTAAGIVVSRAATAENLGAEFTKQLLGNPKALASAAGVLGVCRVRQTSGDDPELFDGNWFDTGDIARIDPDGYLKISGRTKDVIIRGGENIPVAYVENALYENPKVATVAVIGIPDPRLQERACACVVLGPGVEEFTFAEMQQFLGDKGIARQYWPERLEVLPTLPSTASGKIQKYRLREAITGAS